MSRPPRFLLVPLPIVIDIRYPAREIAFTQSYLSISTSQTVYILNVHPNRAIARCEAPLQR